MKRLLMIALCAMLLFPLVACSQNGASPPEVSQDTTTHESALELTLLPEPTTEPTPEPTTEPIPEPLDLDAFEKMQRIQFSYPSSWRREAKEDSSGTGIYYYVTGRNADGFLYLLEQEIEIDSNEEDQFFSEFLAGVAGGGDVSELESGAITIGNTPAISATFKQLIDGKKYNMQITFFHIGKFVYSFATLSGRDSLIEPSNTYPKILNSIEIFEAEPDILDNAEIRKSLLPLAQAYQFDEIVTLIDDYLDNSEVPATDSAHEIKATAELALEVLPRCKIETDDFSGESVLYGGVTEITSKINFVPYISSDKLYYSSINAKIGFRQSGWLFFDSTSIKVAEDKFINDKYSHWDVIRDVLGGNTISEVATVGLRADDIEAILNSEIVPIIRFKSDEGKTRDHTMTNDELTSLNNVYRIVTCIKMIREKIVDWVDQNR